MDNIVNAGVKIDLHIHSNQSFAKDGKKVKNNTIENISILASKLTENEVNICSITDHDTFSYEMYRALKLFEDPQNRIKKVLPGVEFSVEFDCGGTKKELHIVTIFSDANDEKIKGIQQVLDANRPAPSYTESKFLDILREIELDTILIVHQKNSLYSSKPREKDANSLGEQKFWEFVHTDYFEAFEFKNKRNEVMNKSFILKHDSSEDIRFVTGTDCHDWSVYPKEHPDDKTEDFLYTYAKCLPTFKGLVMAVTEQNRLKRVNSFFSGEENAIDNLSLKVCGKKIDVPLSKGINVVIGDNSIGKSLLLHAITDYKKEGQKLKTDVKTGYKKYLKEQKIEVLTKVDKSAIFHFDMQGEVRSKFEENKLNKTEFLSEYFPEPIDPIPYRKTVEEQIGNLIIYLKKKFEIDDTIKQLVKFTVDTNQEQAESLSFVSNLRRSKTKTDKVTEISTKLSVIIKEIEALAKLDIDSADKAYAEEVHQAFILMKEKYDNKSLAIVAENSKIEKVAVAIGKTAEKHHKTISDKQRKREKFIINTNKLTEDIISIIRQKNSLKTFSPKIKTVAIDPRVNLLHKYEFISKLNIEKIDIEYFNNLIQSLLKKDDVINWATIEKVQLEEMLKKTKYDGSEPVLDFIKTELSKKLDEDFSVRNAIINEGMDRYKELSSGLDAQIYFDILSHEKSKPGIYMIDQPEDNISQNAIKNLLDRFHTMAEHRQILLVTHNPQFIVNLDVDNLIYLSKTDDEIQIQSGALEYTCDDYSILEIVAENIDGGLDTIRKRWKKYEKASVV